MDQEFMAAFSGVNGAISISFTGPALTHKEIDELRDTFIRKRRRRSNLVAIARRRTNGNN